MTDLWHYLTAVTEPVVLYGTGDGADKILDELTRRGVPVAGVFASTGFVRSRTYRGMKVLSYAEAVRRFGPGMIVLIAFGSSLPEVTERFFALGARHEVYAPDVPVAGGPLFDAAFYEEHKDELDEARELFSDRASKELFDAIVSFRLTGRLSYLTVGLTDPETVFRTLLRPDRYRIALDLGAYTGDTALSLLELAPGLQTVIALEPDERNFAKLCLNTAASRRVEARFGAAWDKREILSFPRHGGRGLRRAEKDGDSTGRGLGRCAGKTVPVAAFPPDDLLESRVPDFIKIDVEGAERNALTGCEGSITRFGPDLQVALYHRSEDLFALPLAISRMRPSYRFYLRRYPSVPAWDLNLFATEDAR